MSDPFSGMTGLFDFGLSWPAYLFCLLAVFGGTMLQRLAGQGFGMLAAPLVMLVAPDYIPTALLLVGLVVGLSSTSLDYKAIVPQDLPAGFAGRTLGAVFAAMLAASLASAEIFAALVALIVYLGIALSLVGMRVAIRPPALFTAGMTAGIMGTLTAIGAPPMALLYQHVDQRRSAATQNMFFFFGMVVSILALTWQGLVGTRHILFALALSPVVPVALVAAQPLSRRFSKRSIRPAALTLAGLAATVLLLRQFW
ncbi:MAG: sulfite exporter TauE/SafE family protein [Litoreibacter sp.]|nr:sulfite exporter TauE/SafE family protein [Litoreibacter sp.]